MGSGRRPGKFWGFGTKITWKRCGNALKRVFFEEKTAFSKREIPKFRACGATTLSAIIQNIVDVVQIIRKRIILILFMKRLLSKQFSNLQAAIARSTHAQNVSYSVTSALRLDNIWFTGGYGDLYACTNLFSLWLAAETW